MTCRAVGHQVKSRSRVALQQIERFLFGKACDRALDYGLRIAVIGLGKKRSLCETLSWPGDEEDRLASARAEARQTDLPSADCEEAPGRVPGCEQSLAGCEFPDGRLQSRED
jgi:hypothetical protein